MKELKPEIVRLNEDVEQYVLQASRSRPEIVFKKHFDDKYEPLCFVHASDMHNVPETWDRMVQYVNYYGDYISFALHTGDFCGGSQLLYTDMYDGEKCIKPIYNCVGNHDCYSGEGKWLLNKKEIAHGLLFKHTEGWDACFSDCRAPMSYYKDFSQSGIRLIVLDDYYDIPQTREWLKKLLTDALEKGISVITAQHEPTNYITCRASEKFNPYDDFISVVKYNEAHRTEPAFDEHGRLLYEDIIAEFINNGGSFVCNLAGHEHIDYFGYTDAGVLNSVVANGTTWDGISDMRRTEGTKSIDCFNVVAVDVNLGLLKIVRIGADVDHYFRTRTALCYDYINKKMISEV